MYQNRSEGFPEFFGLAVSVTDRCLCSFDAGKIKLDYMIFMSHPWRDIKVAERRIMKE